MCKRFYLLPHCIKSWHKNRNWLQCCTTKRSHPGIYIIGWWVKMHSENQRSHCERCWTSPLSLSSHQQALATWKPFCRIITRKPWERIYAINTFSCFSHNPMKHCHCRIFCSPTQSKNIDINSNKSWSFRRGCMKLVLKYKRTLSIRLSSRLLVI